ASLYFHQNAYSPDGQKLVITTSTGLSTINLKTRAIEKVVDGRVGVIVTGRRSGLVYYSKREGGETVIYATHLDTKPTKRIAAFPRGNVSSVNADETLLLGSYAEGAAESGAPPSGGGAAAQGEMKGPDGKPLTFAEQKEVRLNQRLEQRIPMAMFTVNTATGEIKVIHRATDWLNHLQYSPTDPPPINFCPQGPPHPPDPLHTIRTPPT